jgi:hypothetical protein
MHARHTRPFFNLLVTVSKVAYTNAVYLYHAARVLPIDFLQGWVSGENSAASYMVTERSFGNSGIELESEHQNFPNARGFVNFV